MNPAEAVEHVPSKAVGAPARRTLAYVGFLALAILAAGCTPWPMKEIQVPAHGRERVLQILEAPPARQRVDPLQMVLSKPAVIRNPVPSRISPDGMQPGRPFRVVLRDGTIVGGLFFPHPGDEDRPRSLLLAAFGFLQDRWGQAATAFFARHLREPAARIAAHVLILDHPSAAPFLVANGSLSVGAYDQARMWIEVGRHLDRQMPLDGIHLFGVGISGQTVIHALIEARRLGLSLFRSGIAVSIAPDFLRYPGGALALFEPPAGRQNPWQTGHMRSRRTGRTERLQQQVLQARIDAQFLPHYRAINPQHSSFRLEPAEIPLFFHKAFENRLMVLRRQDVRSSPWNAEFRLEDLKAHLQSIRIAPIIDRVQTPLVLLNAADDPLIPQADFLRIAGRAAKNPWVICHLTEAGGHAGFDTVYGDAYLRRILQVVTDPDVLRNWRAAIYSANSPPPLRIARTTFASAKNHERGPACRPPSGVSGSVPLHCILR